MKKEKIYKAIWLTEEMANKVKILATKRNQTIIQFIEKLLEETKTKVQNWDTFISDILKEIK